MTGTTQHLLKLINGDSQFVIPVFQRDYSWVPDDHGARLLRDVRRAGSRTTVRSHFVGSIVCMEADDATPGLPKWIVIDGQQRLTTLLILLAAMRDLLRALGTETKRGITADKIDGRYLKNRDESGEQQYRMLLRRDDQSALREVLKSRVSDHRPSRIADAYYHFRDNLKEEDLDQVFAGIEKLVVVYVRLDRDKDDPQLIFESLNATGRALSQFDLIRNHILLRLDEATQKELYEQYWYRIEKLFPEREDVFDDFVRDYLDLKAANVIRTKTPDIYRTFCDFWQDQIGQSILDHTRVEAGLEDMLRHARHYAEFRIGTDAGSARDYRYRRIRQISVLPGILVMRLLDRRSDAFGEDSYLHALDAIESFLVRRAVCRWPSNSYDKVFASLAGRIGRSDPLTDLRTGLRLNPAGYSFPSNTDFERALREENLYSRKRVCRWVLEGIETQDKKALPDAGKYSIEHILPQNRRLRPEWRAMLGPEWQEIQEEHVHRLGNLTLTAYNSEYSDRPFSEKKTMKNGFIEVGLSLNSFVNRQERWTATEVVHRTEELAGRAISNWPTPVIDDAILKQAQLEERKKQAAGRTIDKDSMSQGIRELFDHVRSSVLKLGDDIVEIPEPNSVSYHRGGYFLEIVPQKSRLHLLLAPEFDEIRERPAGTENLRSRTYVAGSRYKADSGTIYSVTEKTETIQAALGLIEQAYRSAE